MSEYYQDRMDLNYKLWQVALEQGNMIAALAYKTEYENYRDLVKNNEGSSNE